MFSNVCLEVSKGKKRDFWTDTTVVELSLMLSHVNIVRSLTDITLLTLRCRAPVDG